MIILQQTDRKFKLRKLCKMLISKARTTLGFTFKFRKKIKAKRLRMLKKFGGNYYKKTTKEKFNKVLAGVNIKNFGLVRDKDIFFYKSLPLNTIKFRKKVYLKYNRRVSKENRKSFFFRKRKKKLPKKRKARKLLFYRRFKTELTRRQPLTRFYKMNLELININYNLLLSFHAAIGNSFKTWVSPGVFSSILAIRNDMILFDLSMFFIKLKKGLQMVFQISKQRGSILGFVDYNTNYKFSGKGFDHFLRSWLGGYLTNFKSVMKNLIALKNKKFMSLTRRQKKFFQSLVTQQEVSVKYYYKFFNIKKKFRLKGIPKKKKRKIPAIPQFGFSLEDHNIWLNESHKIGNNVMAICDSDSFPQKVDFPLIANQKSLPLSFFFVKVITEGVYCGKRLDYYSFIGFNHVAKYLR